MRSCLVPLVLQLHDVRALGGTLRFLKHFEKWGHYFPSSENEESLQHAACPLGAPAGDDTPEDGVDFHGKRHAEELQAKPDNKGGDEELARPGVEKKFWF